MGMHLRKWRATGRMRREGVVSIAWEVDSHSQLERQQQVGMNHLDCEAVEDSAKNRSQQDYW